MKKNIFENAKFGDKFLTRNNTIAYFDRYVKEDDKYSLMVQDDENDFVEAFEDGHIFHPDDYDESAWKLYGYDRNDYREYRLDIISRYYEPIDEVKLEKLAINYIQDLTNGKLNLITDIESAKYDFKAGYRKAIKDDE